MSLLTFLTFFSAASFLFFGVACLTQLKMKSEFKRYRLKNYRVMVGTMQLMGAISLVLGHFYSPFLQVSAATGLSILMLSGFIVRLRIGDSFILSAPSFTYAVLNAVIVIILFGRN